MRQILFRSGYQTYIIGFGILFGLLFSIRLWDAGSTEDAFRSLLAAVYWEVFPESGMIGLLLPLVPALTFCAVMSNFLADDAAIIGVYLLPRARNIYKWYLPKLAALWVHALEFSAMFLGCIMIAQRGISWRALLLIGFYTLALCAAVTPMATLSLRLPAKWVVACGTLLLGIMMITAKTSKGKPAAFFHPLYHFFPGWIHKPAISIVCFSLVISASAFIGSFFARQKELFLSRKESEA